MPTVQPSPGKPPLKGQLAEPACRALRRLRQILHGPTGRDEEKEVLDILRGLGTQDLNLVLGRLNLHTLVKSLDDRLWGPDHRKELLDLLTRQRLNEISTQNRGRLVDALQKGRTGRSEEQAIANLLLGTRGAQLTALKNQVDAGRDYRDLQELIYRDIDSRRLRRQILEHVAAEGQAAPTGELKVLSDIDDTLICSLKDRRYPRQTVYPGARQFYRELDQGRPGDLVFLTARPSFRWGVLENRTHRRLQSLGIESATVLSGSILHTLGNACIASYKFRMAAEHGRLFPEYQAVFIGDSGQGDVMAGQRMRRESPQRVKAVFIHDVVATPESERQRYRAEGIYFFDTYVGAGVEAYHLGLIGADGLGRLAAAAVDEFRRIPFESPAQREARRQELARDLDRANPLLPPDRRVQL